MSVYRIPAARHHLRVLCVMLGKVPEKLTCDVKFRKSYVTNIEKTQKKNNTWFKFLKLRWEWTLPVGVGITLLGVLQWRHLRKHPYPADGQVVKGPVADLAVDCYCCLPLRITSRVFGWFAEIQLPVSLRPIFYNLYAKSFDANLQEIDNDLSAFPSLVDFFVRPLKKDARPIDPFTDIVSPSDGRVLHFGPVTSCRVEQVKGMTYNLRHFLGDIKTEIDSPRGITVKQCDDYVKSLLKNPQNCLYQLTVYLAPGDYHRFHSPTDWRINYRRHFQGKLLSVNPRIASWLPDLFSINERVIYVGEWAGGFMAYAAVGATNVGSIKVYCDNELETNKKKWPKGKIWEEANLKCTLVKKGQLFGEFRMGSTIVLLFEAPKDFSFSLVAGQRIKVGQAVTENSSASEKNSRERSTVNQGIMHAIEIITNAERLS